MARTRQMGKRNTVKCSLCPRTFKNQAYYERHLKAGHGVTADYTKYNKNKNILKKFINFIIKIILLINERCEIQNYIGDREDQKNYQFNYNNNEIKIKKSIRDKSTILTIMADIEEEINDGFKKNDEEIENDIKEEKISHKEEPNQIFPDDVLNFLEKLKNKENKNEIKEQYINYNDMKLIKNLSKKVFIEAMKKRYGDDIETNEPFIENIGEFIYLKISVWELFKQVIPSHLKISQWVKQYINIKLKRMKKNDYPCDEIIKEMPEVWNYINKIRLNIPFYGEEFGKIKQIIINFFNNNINEYQCDDCKKFVINKKRHSMICPEFKKKLDEEKEKKLKKYIIENYKKIKISTIDHILKRFEGYNSEKICENLPRVIKFFNKIIDEEKERLHKKPIILKGDKTRWLKRIKEIKEEIEKEMKNEEKNPK